MKRDFNLIKAILLKIEQDENGKNLRNFNIEGYERQIVAYHCEILYNEGYLSSYTPFHRGTQVAMFDVGNLTTKGYDLLDSIRDRNDFPAKSNNNETIININDIKIIKSVVGNGTIDVDKTTNISTDINLNSAKDKKTCMFYGFIKKFFSKRGKK